MVLVLEIPAGKPRRTPVPHLSLAVGGAIRACHASQYENFAGMAVGAVSCPAECPGSMGGISAFGLTLVERER